MPATFVNSENKDAARIQIGQFVLNHRINASGMTPVIDADNSDWSAVSDALFIGSVSTTQAVFRFAYDAENVYCLVERLDKDLTTDDSMELIFRVEMLPELLLKSLLFRMQFNIPLNAVILQ